MLLEELVSREELSRIEQSLTTLFGFTVVFESLNKDIITHDNDEARPLLCPVSELVNMTPEGKEACLLSDNEAARLAMETGRTALYRCHAYLNNFAIPIIVGRTPIATLYGGQFLMREPRPQQARELNERFHQLNVMKVNSVQDGTIIKPFAYYREFTAEEARERAREVGDRSSLVDSDVRRLQQAYQKEIADNVKDAGEVLNAIEVAKLFADIISARASKEFALRAAQQTQAAVLQLECFRDRKVKELLRSLRDLMSRLEAEAGTVTDLLDLTEMVLERCTAINDRVVHLVLRETRRGLLARRAPHALFSERYEEAKRCLQRLEQLHDGMNQRDDSRTTSTKLRRKFAS